jgi:DNA-directed RNA polymerase specialized sigma24 family protein
MRHYERTKRALYWTAVSLIVCEGLPLEQAARRMGIDHDQLKDILHRRRTVRLDQLDLHRLEDAASAILPTEHLH